MHLLKTKFAAVGAGTAALLIAAGPALASPPYTVGTDGGATAATVTANLHSGTQAVLTTHDAGGTPIQVICNSSTVHANLDIGTNKNPVADITSVSFSSCTAPGGAVTVSTSSFPWELWGTGAATSGIDSHIDGYIDGVHASVASAIPGVCDFDVTGSADGFFNETHSGTAQSLTVDEHSGTNLLISGVSGCGGAVAGAVDFDATYDTVTTNSSTSANDWVSIQ